MGENEARAHEAPESALLHCHCCCGSRLGAGERDGRSVRGGDSASGRRCGRGRGVRVRRRERAAGASALCGSGSDIVPRLLLLSAALNERWRKEGGPRRRAG